MNNYGTLFVVPTPIGNLEDITIRAIKILKTVDYIACEDTRNTRKLLKKYSINVPLFSYHKFNEKKKLNKLINDLINGKNIALVSDAGTPGISDPGPILISESLKKNIRVETLPGATAFVPALVNSGFDISNFYFVGFLPKKNNEILYLLNSIKNLDTVLIIYEAPHRLEKTLKILFELLGNRYVYIAREITKLYESNYRGYLSQLIENNNIIKKGEFVIVIDRIKIKKEIDFENLMKLIEVEISKGSSEKDAIRLISQRFNVSKNKLYSFFYKNKVNKEN